MHKNIFTRINTWPKKVSFILAGGLVVAGSSGGLAVMNSAHAASNTGQASLQQAIDAVLADARLNGAQVGVLVRSASDGSTLYSHNPTSLLVPASNDKLYTSTAAEKVLGTDYRFTTTVAASGQQAAGIVNGNLYLKGTGDPTMQADDYDTLAAAVAAKGVKLVTGQLVADDSFFDHRQLGYNWGWDSNPFYYQPEISALTVAADAKFNIGALTVETTPGAAVGQPAQIKTLPATSYVTIDNQTTTGAAGTANTISVERKLGVNTIVVTGSIPLQGSTEDDISTVTDPTGYAASLFRDALARHGVTVLGQTSRSTTPANATTITTRQSMPLSQLFTPFLKLSNNGIADTLLKTMGAKANGQGTFDNGVATELPVLGSEMGVDTSRTELVDGSGLSNVNLTTPEQTTNLLLAARSKPWFQNWYNALPIAGQSDPLVGGTLRSRMVGTAAAGNVHAKTGSLDNVSALSGYVTDADGQPLVFSIMETDYIENFSPKPLEDKIAVALANFSQNGGVKQAGLNFHPNASAAPVTQAKGKAAPHNIECSWTKQGC